LEDTPVEEIARALVTRRISAVPVIDLDEKLVGIVSEGDLMRQSVTDKGTRNAWWLERLVDSDDQARSFAQARGRLAKDVMSTSVITAVETDSLAGIARILEKHKVKRVPIVRQGKLVGIVSRANLLHGLAAVPGSGLDASPPPAPSQVASPQPDDHSIRATILNKIHNDIRVRSPINVIVMKGAVDLWGGVETEAQRQAVRVAAEAAPNVKSVNDHLTVWPAALRVLLKDEASS
jgi:CBS domain-containing protein